MGDLTTAELNKEECLFNVYDAWLAAKARKSARPEVVRFTSLALDSVYQLTDELLTNSWKSAIAYRFVVTHPKGREVYAAPFQDRIVHHYLVRALEQIWEPKFIFDAASNRKGKGTHFAVSRLQKFMRQHSGKGWYIQLDIQNFFHSINQNILLEILEKGIAKSGLSAEAKQHFWFISREIIQGFNPHTATQLASDNELKRVPIHKQLTNMPLGNGLPIGNLTSQFFANVYMNELDQFVKHKLKCKHYIRYVDDFILLSDDVVKLMRWEQQIRAFVSERLCIQVKPSAGPIKLAKGADFLGYIVFPWHRLVRKRVVGQCRSKLNNWQQKYRIKKLHGWLFNGEHLAQIAAVYASYLGHFEQANHTTLKQRCESDYPWVKWLPCLKPKANCCIGMINQFQYFIRHYPGCVVLLQKGFELAVYKTAVKAHLSLFSGWRCNGVLLTASLKQLNRMQKEFIRNQIPWLYARETHFQKNGLKQRQLAEIWVPETYFIRSHA